MQQNNFENDEDQFVRNEKVESKFMSYIKNPTYLIGGLLVLGIISIGSFWFFSSSNTSILKSLGKEIYSGENKGLPPEAAINACNSKTVGDICQFSDNGNIASGVCDDKPGVLACKKSETEAGQQANKGGGKNSENGSENITGSSQYTIEQAISDKAQLNTMAFGGLGFITGNTCSDSFLPPGKVADFFGFQYLRDTTQAGKGHSTDFVTNCANNVLKTLSSDQKAKMLALAKTQEGLVNEFAYKRFPLMVAFRRQLEGNIPSGSTGLSKEAVMNYSTDLYVLDAQISLQRAKLFGEIINSFNSEQKTFIDGMVKGGFSSWASIPNQADKGLTKTQSVLMMTYASEMFGWYAGNVESDTYFCPERQANYFGGFYIKDAPAIGNAGYTIDESITGDKGEAFLSALSSQQKTTITSAIDTQKSDLNSIVEIRQTISTELRKILSGGTIDEGKVMDLAKEYGALDGGISYLYATSFANVGKTLTTEQKATLYKLRGLDGYQCPDSSAYLYSEKINMPTVQNTDFLFAK